jgi:hypothetical protein
VIEARSDVAPLARDVAMDSIPETPVPTAEVTSETMLPAREVRSSIWAVAPRAKAARMTDFEKYMVAL